MSNIIIAQNAFWRDVETRQNLRKSKYDSVKLSIISESHGFAGKTGFWQRTGEGNSLKTITGSRMRAKRTFQKTY